MRFVDILIDEHRAFGRMLDVLDAISMRLEHGGHVPAAMLTDVIDFFERFSDQHHRQEEVLLFPLLARHGIGADQTVVNALASQHEAGRVYGARMRAEAWLLRDGGAGSAASLAADSAAYSELLREHIRIEDEYFYALADQVLTTEEHQTLSAELERAASNPSAQAARSRFLRMLDVYPAVVAGWTAAT